MNRVTRSRLTAADLLEITTGGSWRGLPGAAYTLPEVFTWEREQFWVKGWVCVGRAGDLPEPGDQRAAWVAGRNLLLVRTSSSDINVFLNSCRHRGHELVQPDCPVRRPNIWCAYHAWVYQLDGSLRSAPRFDSDGIDISDLSLLRVRSEQWQGWIFVNISGDAPPLSGALGNLAEHVTPYGLDGLTVGHRKEYDVPANWKLIFENYLECYHCPSTHPQLSKVQRTNGGENWASVGNWLGGYLDLRNRAETMSLSGEGIDWRFAGLTENHARQVCYYGLLPNLLITGMADYVLIHRLEPLAADLTQVTCEWLFDPAIAARADLSFAVDFWHLTNSQDWAACASVQRGVANNAYIAGPLHSTEDALYAFVQAVADAHLHDRPLFVGRAIAARSAA